MIILPLPLPIRMCRSAVYAIMHSWGKGKKTSECIKNVGISILKEILVVY